MKNNQIKLGAILSYVAIGVNILAGLLYTPWMIQQIGKSDYGLYTLANSLITLFLVDFGLSAATTKFVSDYIARDEQENANNFLGTVYKLYLLIDTIIFSVLLTIFFCIEHIYVNLTPGELEKFKIVYAIAALYSVINFPFVTLNGVLSAYEKFIQLKMAEILQRILTILFTVIALCFGWGLYALVSVNAIVGIIIICYKYLLIKKFTPTRANFSFKNNALYKAVFAFSSWSTLATVSQLLIFNITPTILGIVANTTDIAIFGVVITIESYSYMVTAAIKGMFMPRISRIYAKDDTGDIMPLMIRVGKFQLVLNGIIVAGFITIGKSFIQLWMGTEFYEAYAGILLVIIPGLFFNSLQIANTAMLVKNKVKEQALITLTIGIINVMLSFPLSRKYGVMGACLSIFFAYVVRAVLYHIVHYKVMRIDIWNFIKKCYFKVFPALGATLIFGYLLNWFVKDGGWYVLGFKALLICVFYVIVTFLFAFDLEERQKALKSLRWVKRNVQDR